MISKIAICVILMWCGSGFNVSPPQEYSCALTEDEYAQLNNVRREWREKDRRWEKQLWKINPSFGNKYARLKTKKEKTDYVEYLVNHEFDTIVDIRHPENKHIHEFLKSLDFTIVSGKDVDRCFPVKEELRREYKDKLRFYYSPLSKSGCELFVYEVTHREDIDKLACFLRKVSDQFKTGTLYVQFYEKEVFEPEKTLSDGSATIRARGNEKMIETLIINSEFHRRKSNRH